jgi:hypothetical protein
MGSEWSAGPSRGAWFEDSSGEHFVPDYGGSCSGNPISIIEGMSKEAVLLKPCEHFDGTFQLDSKLFDLKPEGIGSRRHCPVGRNRNSPMQNVLNWRGWLAPSCQEQSQTRCAYG